MATTTVGAIPGSIVIHPTGAVPVAYINYPDSVSIMEFGATGNGTTDDSAAFITAFAALSGSGVALFVPAGTFYVNTTAPLNPGVQLKLGAGASITGQYANNVQSAGALPMYVRAVMTTISGTYAGTGTSKLTASANAAFGTMDGVSTLAVGDTVLLQGGSLNSHSITAADTGPWVIQSLGGASAKWVLVRPSWWATGAVMPLMAQIKVGPEGTLFGGTTWTSWAVAGKVIGTDDPTFYPDTVVTQVTLASSTATLATVPIRSATASGFFFSLAAVGGTNTNTVGYGIIAAPTPGYVGTATLAVDAVASGQTKNGSSDTSIVSVMIKNRSV